MIAHYLFLEKFQNNWIASKILNTHFKTLLILHMPNPMSICIIIQQWVSCFMHERKNVWTICPADQSLQRYSVLLDSPILCRDCTLWQKENRTVSIPVRRNNSRNRPQSQKKTGSRFYLSRDPICMQICLNPDPCPFTRLYWRKFVLSLSRFSSVKSCRFKREGEREIRTTQNFSIYFNCRILENI